LGASPIRTSVAVGALIVAIGMTVSVAVLIASFRTTVTAWANESLRADLFLKPLGLADASFDQRFSSGLVEAVRRVPGVAAVDTFRGVDLPFRGGITTLAATDLAQLATHAQLRLLDGDAAVLARTLPGSDGVLVSAPFVNRWGLGTGDRVTLPTPSGPHTFTIAATYNDYSSDGGIVLADVRTFRRLFHDDTANSMAVYARPGTDLVELRTRIVRALAPARIDVTTNAELRKLVLEIFDRTFAITYALFVVSIVIAVMAVLTTLFALVLERRREIGLLRYLGLRTGEVRAVILGEAAALGALGGIGGVALGMPLALLLIFVINRQSFGWLIDLHVPFDLLAETVVLVVGASLIAGLWPAALAARIRTADAVREE
jgi:putative ABC transport system permease protein